MKKPQQTYSTVEMLKLINNAGMNLMLRKKKIALESKIERQKEERDYLKEILSGLKSKLSELDPEFKEAQSRLNELEKTHNTLKSQWEDLQREIDKKLEIQKKLESFNVKKTELSNLSRNLSYLESTCNDLKVQRDRLSGEHSLLFQSKNDSLRALQTLKEELFANEKHQQSLINQISGFDIEGYIGNLMDKVAELEDNFKQNRYKQSIKDELNNISSILFYERKADEIAKILDNVSKTELDLLNGFKKIKDAGSISQIIQRLNILMDNLVSEYKQETTNLLTEKEAQQKELNSLKEQIGLLEKSIQEKQQQIKVERDFKENSLTQIKGLETEIQNRQKELEDLKVEAQRLAVNIEINKSFAELLEQLNDSLMKSNKRLLSSLQEYKEAYERLIK